MSRTQFVRFVLRISLVVAAAGWSNGCSSNNSGGTGGTGGHLASGGTTGKGGSGGSAAGGSGGGGAAGTTATGSGGGGAAGTTATGKGGAGGGAGSGAAGGSADGGGGHTDAGTGHVDAAKDGLACLGPLSPKDADGSTLHGEVQTLLNTHCIACHSPKDGGSSTTLPHSLDFRDIGAIVATSRASSKCNGDAGPAKLLIDPGHPEKSYIVDKVLGRAQDCGCFMGARMPYMCSAPEGGPAHLACLMDSDIQTIVDWIGGGAH